MKYKRRGNVPLYLRRKNQRHVPLSAFVKEAPLPQKATRRLKNAEFVTTIKCDICHENTLKLYRKYIRGLPPQGYMVCANPECEAYGVVMPT